ncbi:MAG: hypothetical protein AAF526_08705 [Pseudomonadota bacterium]
MRIIAVVLTLLATAASADAPFQTKEGGYRIDWRPDRQTLEIYEEPARNVYFDVTGCVFGRRVSGVFALYFEDTSQTFVAQHCQTEGGDRLSIYAPEDNADGPVFELYGDRVNYRLHPDRVAVTSRKDGNGFSIDWRPGGRLTANEQANHADPGSLDDPLLPRQLGLANLDSAMRDPELRQAIAGDATDWPGWSRLLLGGWVVGQTDDGNQRAALPAERANWPDHLDPNLHLYGDRPGARLLAAPHSAAPALFPIHRRILTRGPALPGDGDLVSAGWIYLCAGQDGCGFARLDDVADPLGPTASFIRPGPGHPWQLERLETD